MIVHFGEQHIALIMQITIASLLPRENSMSTMFHVQRLAVSASVER
ncbi:hypothetical protein T09_15417 [Trichinella sp. T9]|nr:hypothetical protein T09_15417 [Trichinella sp. T9]